VHGRSCSPRRIPDPPASQDQLFTSLVERPLFFFFGDSVTRTPRIPDVLGIHVRVINSALLALRRFSPVFLSFGAHRRFPIFRTALIPSGVPPKLLRPRCFPSSPPALCFIVSPSRLMYRSIRDASRLFAPSRPAAGEYYADAATARVTQRHAGRCPR